MTEDIRYPIGQFKWDMNISLKKLSVIKTGLSKIPAKLRSTLAGITDPQLDIPYRKNGWSVRQIANHLADSSLLGFALYKYGLTEKEPELKHYDCTAWGGLNDARLLPLDTTLTFMDCLYEKWMVLINSMDKEMWMRTVNHEYLGKNSLKNLLQVYEWHGRHHIAQISLFRKRIRNSRNQS